MPSHLEESLAFLERFLSATLGYMAQKGGKRQGKKQCLEEKATVPRWLQSPYVRNTYAKYWWQDRKTRMWASSSQPQTFRTPTDGLLNCPSICLHPPHAPVCSYKAQPAMHCPKSHQLHIVCGIFWSSWGPVILPQMNLMVINEAQVLRESGKSGKG